MKLILANQAVAAKRRVFFFCVNAVNGIIGELGEAGGQPELSTDGVAWTPVGIGTLVAIGNGFYYAELTQAAVATVGTVIATRYKSASTAEAPGTMMQVVAFDPDAVAGLGLTNVDATISSRAVPGDAMALTPAERTAMAGKVWDEAVPGAHAAGTAGKKVGDDLDATVSSRAAPGAAMALTPAERATLIDGIWDDPAPGTHPVGSAGQRIGVDLDATVSSRATQAQILSDATPFPGARIDAFVSTRAVPGDAMALTPAERATLVAQTWDEAVPGAHALGTAARVLGDNLDAKVSTRATPAQINLQTYVVFFELGLAQTLSLLLSDGNNAQFPRATIILISTGLPEAVVDLVSVGGGRYTGPWTPATPGPYAVTYVVYSDAGHTVVNPAYSQVDEIWQQDFATVDQLWNAPYAGHEVPTTFGGLVSLIEQMLNNRLELGPGAAANWTLYKRDDITVLRVYDVTDAGGNAIVCPASAPARRTRGV